MNQYKSYCTNLDGRPIFHPHLDSLVLHARGKCAACDDFPRSQDMRLLWQIGFTQSEYEHVQTTCPALARRSLDVIETEVTNRPMPYKCKTCGK